VSHARSIAVAIAFACALPAFAQAPTPALRNETLLTATSPFEDLSEFALAEDAPGITKALAEADVQAAAVRKVLPAAAAAQFDALTKTIHQAATDKQHYVLALNAVETFRLLLDQLDAKGLEVPKEILLLDYTGFKLHVLEAAPQADWEAVRKTVADGVAWWTTTKPKIKDVALSDAMNSTIRGLQEGAKSENQGLVHFAAQLDLDLVDLLEGIFEGK
jgi:hypothetical protein